MDTPLSDAITKLVADTTPDNWHNFFQTLLEVDLGVIAHGLPEGFEGTHQTQSDEVGVGRTVRDGMNLVLTCADFDIFRERFPAHGFNAEMDALSVFRTALADPSCDGILVNSAASEHSIPITRDQLGELIASQASN